MHGVGHVADEHVAKVGHEVGPLVEPPRRAALRRRLGEQHERERVARPSSASRAQAEAGAPKRPTRSALSAASNGASAQVRRSRRQPASADHAEFGGSRPASTATAPAGSDGSSSRRNQRSSGVSSS